jgi:hypothetical protein
LGGSSSFNSRIESQKESHGSPKHARAGALFSAGASAAIAIANEQSKLLRARIESSPYRLAAGSSDLPGKISVAAAARNHPIGVE